jgi:short-subunit dehydrogenase
MKTQHPKAVITGATSGIGRSFALKLAEKGYDLVLTGRRKKELNEVVEDISTKFNVRVETIIGDLTDEFCREKISNRIKSEHSIDLLINNAGFGIDHAFHRIALEDVHSMIMTHDMAAIDFIHAALPGMINLRKGAIINVSSFGLFFPGFTRSLYLATKSFIHYFTKALSMEVYPYGVRVQSLCPGMTYSDFHMRSGSESIKKVSGPLPFMSPERVVTISLKALEEGSVVCIPGTLNKLMLVIAKLLPVCALRWLSRNRIEKPQSGIKVANSGLALA